MLIRDFPEMIKKKKDKCWEGSMKNSSRVNKEKRRTRNIVVKLQNSKEKTLKADR